MERKLGKLPKKIDPRTLRLANYIPQISTQVPKPKSSVNYAKLTDNWGMLLNDTYGDCTIAGALHLQQAQKDTSSKARDSLAVTDAEALEGYERICGFNPKDPTNTDNGGVLLDVLNAWRKDGIGGNKIDAFATVDRQRHDLVKLACEWFGGLYIGVGLPESAQDQKIWKVVKGVGAQPYSWGGHCVPVVAYSKEYLTVLTWGALLKMTWGFWDVYIDEAYIIVDSANWIDATGATPEGLKLSELMGDVNVVAKAS
jgi:hypothetical protein